MIANNTSDIFNYIFQKVYSHVFIGDVDRVIEWQIWEGVSTENSDAVYLLLINDQLVFMVMFFYRLRIEDLLKIF